MGRRLPVRNRGDTPLDELGNPMRRVPFPDNYGVLHGNASTGGGSERTSGGGSGGLSCGFTEFGGGGGRGGDARHAFYYVDPFSQQPILYFTLTTKQIQDFYL